MSGNISVLQSLQDVFSKSLNFFLVISDDQGQPITSESGDSEFIRLLKEKRDLSRERARFLQNFHRISSPILYDYQPGIKGIVAPIPVNESTKYYVWTSFIIDENTIELIDHFFSEQTGDEYKHWQPALEALPRVSESKKREILNEVGLFARMASEHLKDLQNSNHSSLSFVNRQLEVLAKNESSVERILKQVLAQFKELDFVGIAEKTEFPDFYSVSFYLGPTEGTLTQKEFSTGEGFLGEVAATGKGKVWTDVSSDPRIGFFSINHIHPKSIMSFPLIINNEVEGVFFGGTIDHELSREDYLVTGQTVAQLITLQFKKTQMEKSINQYFLQISTFNDILQLMTTMSDVKRILFVLVDISINLTNSPFSCVILKPQDNSSQATVVSRGMNHEQIQTIGRVVADRYFYEDDQEFKPSHQDTSIWDDQALLIPIHYREKTLGCLAISIHEVNQLQDIKRFLFNLATAAGVLIATNQSSVNETDTAVEALYMGLSQYNPEEYALIQEEQALLKEFYGERKSGHSNFEHVQSASKLKNVDQAILKTLMPDHPVLTIIDQFRSCQQEDIDSMYTTGEEAQILYMVRRFIESNNIEEIKSMTYMNQRVKEEFQHFLLKKMRSEGTIELSQSTDRQHADIVGSLRETLSLSGREEEVLRLVVSGYSNKNIANELFISEHTVKNHITKIFQKLQVSDRAQAISKVYELSTAKPARSVAES